MGEVVYNKNQEDGVGKLKMGVVFFFLSSKEGG